MMTTTDAPVADRGDAPATTSPGRGRLAATRARGFALRWGVLAVFALAWQLVTQWAATPYFPPLAEILARVHTTWLSGPANRLFLTDAVAADIVPSLYRLLLGWALAVLVGVAVGFVLGLARGIEEYVDPLVHFLRAIPPPVLIPLFIILLGIGDGMKIVLITSGVVWPILLNTVDGVRSVDRTQLETGQVYGIPRRKRLTHIVLPSALPKIFAGLRVSLSLALILMVISEMFAATDGIGFWIVSSQRSFRLVDMWAGIVVLGVLGYVLNAVLLAVEHRLLAWHRGVRGSDA